MIIDDERVHKPTKAKQKKKHFVCVNWTLCYLLVWLWCVAVCAWFGLTIWHCVTFTLFSFPTVWMNEFVAETILVKVKSAAWSNECVMKHLGFFLLLFFSFARINHARLLDIMHDFFFRSFLVIFNNMLCELFCLFSSLFFVIHIHEANSMVLSMAVSMIQSLKTWAVRNNPLHAIQQMKKKYVAWTYSVAFCLNNDNSFKERKNAKNK